MQAGGSISSSDLNGMQTKYLSSMQMYPCPSAPAASLRGSGLIHNRK
jgi:hypothetical protein